MKPDVQAAIRAAKGWNLAYVASPYRKYPHGHWRAAATVALTTARLMKLGVKCFSPICHGWSISQFGGISSTNNKFWAEANAPFVDACEGLIVIDMESWEVSDGVIEEIKAFTVAGKPIVHVRPEDLE